MLIFHLQLQMDHTLDGMLLLIDGLPASGSAGLTDIVQDTTPQLGGHLAVRDLILLSQWNYLCGQSSKIRFHYDSTTDLPDASTWHGMFAHVHSTGKAYYAHAGAWQELANVADIPARY